MREESLNAINQEQSPDTAQESWRFISPLPDLALLPKYMAVRVADSQRLVERKPRPCSKCSLVLGDMSVQLIHHFIGGGWRERLNRFRKQVDDAWRFVKAISRQHV